MGTLFLGRLAPVLLALAVLAPAPAAGGPALQLEGSDWLIPSMQVKTGGKVKAPGGGAKAKGVEFDSLALELGTDGTFTGTLAGELPLSGTWTRKSEKARVAKLTLDAASLEALETYEQELAEAILLEEGFPADVVLTVVASDLRVRVKTKPKAGTAALHVRGRFRFEGSVTLSGQQLPLRAKSRLRGTSLAVELADLLAAG